MPDGSGRIYPCNHWADWYPDEGLTHFGGYWRHVPPMPSSSEPDEDTVDAWASKYGGWAEGVRIQRQGSVSSVGSFCGEGAERTSAT